MSMPNLTGFEEQLLEACQDNERLNKFRRSAIMTGITFAVVFGCLAVKMQVSFWISAILAGYALIVLSEVNRFRATLACHREFLLKLAKERFQQTEDEDCGNLVLETQNSRIERNLWQNTCLLAAFQIVSVICIPLAKLPYANGIVAGVTILFVLLILCLKLTVVNTMLYYRKMICRTAEQLKNEPVSK